MKQSVLAFIDSLDPRHHVRPIPTLPGLSAEERVLDQLERNSQRSVDPRGNQGAGVNEEILRRTINSSEQEYEEQSCRSGLKRPGVRGTIGHAANHEDFRDELDRSLCPCSDGTTCQICVTEADLMAFRPSPHIQREAMPAVHAGVKRFLLKMPVDLGIALGVIDEAYDVVTT